jgi:hypothetical protein
MHTEDAPFVRRVLAGLPRAICPPSDVADIAAQCDSNDAIAFSLEDGMFVVQLRPHGDELELYVLAAVAFRFGAFERQEPAVLEIARDLGAKTVAFWARRRGWGRRLGPEWFRRGTDEFVRDV